MAKKILSFALALALAGTVCISFEHEKDEKNELYRAPEWQMPQNPWKEEVEEVLKKVKGINSTENKIVRVKSVNGSNAHFSPKMLPRSRPNNSKKV